MAYEPGDLHEVPVSFPILVAREAELRESGHALGVEVPAFADDA